MKITKKHMTRWEKKWRYFVLDSVFPRVFVFVACGLFLLSILLSLLMPNITWMAVLLLFWLSLCFFCCAVFFCLSALKAFLYKDALTGSWLLVWFGLFAFASISGVMAMMRLLSQS